VACAWAPRHYLQQCRPSPGPLPSIERLALADMITATLSERRPTSAGYDFEDRFALPIVGAFSNEGLALPAALVNGAGPLKNGTHLKAVEPDVAISNPRRSETHRLPRNCRELGAR